ncbi:MULTISPECIES: DUF3089 domain-containing protein [unclassified Iodidimonas]|uniref:DUF3089 domain-containing protein n=1 Tax=unclassified Iodidimonas TaxID=2626145 RepID=UPI0024828216|nr:MULTISPECIES: DUF3089 domain-containing protein [unclassified Iodidimonas]
MARIFLYGIATIIGLLIAGSAVLYAFWDEAQMFALQKMIPQQSYSQAPQSPAPDYSLPESWAAWPGADGDATVTPQGVAPLDPLSASLAADVFFIHPTTYLGTDFWNAPIDEPSATASIPSVLKAQASPFAASAQIYAPRYRQAAFGAFIAANADTVSALMLAYRDIDAAFDAFLAARGADRPFLLVGHSQGALLGSFLLKNRIAGTPLADKMVAAYLPGWTFSLTHDLGALPAMGACEDALDTGCVLSWQSFGENGNPDYMIRGYQNQMGLDGQLKGQSPMLCINPINWQPDGAAPRSAHLGSVPPVPQPDAALPAPLPQALAAQCRDDGFLYLSPNPGEAFSRFLMPGENYHVYDIHLFAMDIRANARDRIKAWVEKHGAASISQPSPAQ